MPRRSRRSPNSRRTSSSPRSRNSRRKAMRNAGPERKRPAIGSSSDSSRRSARPRERGGNHDREDRRRVAFDRYLSRGLLDLAPGNPFSHPRAAQAPIPFRRRRDVDRVIEPAAKLVPPDRVMLRDASSDHQGTGFLRTEHQVGQVRLVAELVDREALMILPEGPKLVPDRAVEDGGHVYRDG